MMITAMAASGKALARGCIELLLFFPLFLLLTLYVLPESPGRWLWLATLPLCHWAGYALGRVSFLRSFVHLPLLLCLAAAALLHSYAWMGGTALFPYIWPAGFVFGYRGSRTAVVRWIEYFPPGYYVVGIVLYFVTSIFMRFIPFMESTFAPYQPLLLWCGIPSLALMMLMVNQSYLKQETLSGKKNAPLTASVLWQNRALAMALFTAAVLIAVFPLLQQAVLWLKEKLLGGFNLSGNPLKFELAPKEAPRPPRVSEMPSTPQSEPSEWLIWLQKAGMILVYIFMGAVIIFIVYRLARLLIGWIRNSYKWLLEFLSQGERKDNGIGYEDDVESIMDWRAFRNVFASRFGSLFKNAHREPRWDELHNNRERARYLYRAMLTMGRKAGYKAKPYLTPKETGQELGRWETQLWLTPEPVVSVYEKVRYGDKEVSDEEIVAAKQALDGRMKEME
ncbi:DUF4129 domain-containing protein [Paenibacillus allorhizosphaerae]|uniref:Protein-glutamine gamma-glutamyltransferase-like C-terminal domain-containing protein n=1 Tax=Paenibacillus allorhizosphaerae TaxID=2849866 RepID=A0ABM8VEK0_9BACL|nr:DUF4129 domain-containing protein [Paenibacillus allorhizosphaerae]CAG7631654.1 hypothetical protein PAECIP111802_01765 [Paenibacillus allorhizosphaerae]